MAFLPLAALKERIRNYRTSLRLLENYGRDESWLGTRLSALRQSVWPGRTILFAPELPDHHQLLLKLCAVNGFRMRIAGETADIAHKHHKATFSPGLPFEQYRNRHVINVRCNDISKRYVQEQFEDVFEYALEVDPRTFRGQAVRKSDDNYRHDGVIIECPLEETVPEGVVFQRLIDSSDGTGYCIDYRVPVVGNEIPLVYIKPRPIDNRFATYSSAEIAEPVDVLKPDEAAQILRFCRRIGMDFGELDVLRDNLDGRIYIVDANNTPAGPPVKLDDRSQRVAVQKLAESYRRLVARVIDGSYDPYFNMHPRESVIK